MSKGAGNSGQRPPVKTGDKDLDGLPNENYGYTAPLPKGTNRPKEGRF
jgi:hypothetical protein